MPALTAATLDIGANGQWKGAQGTITADKPVFSSTATWNASGVTFTHLKANITDTASAAASLLIDLQVGGVSQFKVTKAGALTAGTYNGQTISSAASFTGTAAFAGAVTLSSTLAVTSNAGIGAAISATAGLNLVWMGANNSALTSKNDAASSANQNVWNAATAGDNTFLTFFTEAAATARGSIDYNRGGTAVRYNTTSDARLKDRVGDFDGRPILLATKIHSFRWKETDAESFGVFAQEAVQVNPLAVSVGDDGEEVVKPWGVDYSKYVAPLISGWQNHEARLAALEAKLH